MTGRLNDDERAFYESGGILRRLDHAFIARNHPMYPENTYWRGRIWAPLNFLVYMGMRRYEGYRDADTVDKSMELFMKEWTEHGHVREI
ncbi:MAG: MGH1-like glycoside hydrolase domain-containing protein [Eisenbergiella sp.]